MAIRRNFTLQWRCERGGSKEADFVIGARGFGGGASIAEAPLSFPPAGTVLGRDA